MDQEQQQYERRALPTERLVQLYREGALNVTIECFPYSVWIARYAVEIGAAKRWDENVWKVQGVGCEPEQVRLVVTIRQ